MRIKCFAALLAAVLLLTACTAAPDTNKTESLDVESIYASFESTLPEMTQFDEDRMLNLLGLSSDKYARALVYVASDGLLADEIWLVEAKDADTLAEIKTLAETRLRLKGKESQTYSPAQYAIIQKAQVITHGNYLAVIVSPEVEQLSALYKAAAGI